MISVFSKLTLYKRQDKTKQHDYDNSIMYYVNYIWIGKKLCEFI